MRRLVLVHPVFELVAVRAECDAYRVAVRPAAVPESAPATPGVAVNATAAMATAVAGRRSERTLKRMREPFLSFVLARWEISDITCGDSRSQQYGTINNHSDAEW
jgi:hypothetical protein